MPSRCANTGTRASACTRATRLLPPRGTITSIVPSRPGEHQRRPRRDRASAPAGSRPRASPPARRPCEQRGVDGARGAMAVGAAAQDRGVAGLEAQRAGIGRHVGAALVDDADHAERRAHALDRHAVRPLPSSTCTLPTGSLSVGDHLEALGHRPDARGVSRLSRSRNAPVDAGRLRLGDVGVVGGQDRAAPWRGSPSAIASSALSFCARRRERQACAQPCARAGRCPASGGYAGGGIDILERGGHLDAELVSVSE